MGVTERNQAPTLATGANGLACLSASAGRFRGANVGHAIGVTDFIIPDLLGTAANPALNI
jgi:hypothetical protein